MRKAMFEGVVKSKTSPTRPSALNRSLAFEGVVKSKTSPTSSSRKEPEYVFRGAKPRLVQNTKGAVPGEGSLRP